MPTLILVRRKSEDRGQMECHLGSTRMTFYWFINFNTTSNLKKNLTANKKLIESNDFVNTFNNNKVFFNLMFGRTLVSVFISFYVQLIV